MKDLVKISDELSTARNFVECAYLACHDLEQEKAGPLAAVLDAASDKLKAIMQEIDAMCRSSNDS